MAFNEHTNKFIGMVYALPMNEQGNLGVSKEQLVKSHLRLVASIARQKYHSNLYFDDILQEGNLALWKAVEKFDPSLGFTFTTFAKPIITHAMMNAAMKMKHSMILFTTHALRKAYFNIDKYRINGAVLTQEQVVKMSKDLDISIDTIRECERRLSVSQISETSGMDDGEDDDYSLSLMALSDIDNEPSNILENLQKHDLVTNKFPAAMNLLNDREKDIISSRFMQEVPETLDFLGKKYGISWQRVDQIAKSGMKKIREQLKDYA